MDWEQIANVATALALALMSGISIGRRIPVRSDGKLAEAGKLLAQDAALGRGLRSAMERMRDQGRFTGPKVSQRADWDLALPEDSATYQLQLRRTPAPQSGEAV